MSNLAYYIVCGVLVAGVLGGIAMMSRVKTAVAGNALSAVCTAAAIFVTLYKYHLLTQAGLWICLALGLAVGLVGAYRVKMIQMPQTVALLNGFGGAASALVAAVSLMEGLRGIFSLVTAGLALAVGMITLTGSLIAAGKLQKLIAQRPVVWKGHSVVVGSSIVLTLATVILTAVPMVPVFVSILLCAVCSGFFGVAFAIRVGGADMPITISLLNSLSGVAGAIAGMAIGDPLLVAIGGVVGASGLLLTQIMCRAMNRHLGDILLGKTSAPAKKEQAAPAAVTAEESAAQPLREAACEETSPAEILRQAKNVIIVPGYGMALAQAQQAVKQLADLLESRGAQVRFAIHPVAGRMPGHMNVLLCEADVPYEQLYEMEAINGDFRDCDVSLVIGANDVVNPAANTAEGRPIYGMPVLNVADAKHVIICNYDLKPGYAGVENPLYHKEEGVSLLLGDAKDTLRTLCDGLSAPEAEPAAEEQAEAPEENAGEWLHEAKEVIIVPGYGMALAQAQKLVKQLADKLERQGTQVKFAIHPVAGRMPGHMNVLLCEADVPYEQLYEMDAIDSEFKECDVAMVIGANDVVNPAANTAEGTPIYGMPVLSVDQAKHVIICNYDLKPGYAGVDNPLYHRQGVTLLLGDAQATLQSLLTRV
uniref:NAD(P)(+) transhydrogenase (Re/Si-specific) subunit beta n=1 Tax=Candidatus Fimivicinus sp. TaxID=3056640 RepID=UPI003FF0A79B